MEQPEGPQDQRLHELGYFRYAPSDVLFYELEEGCNLVVRPSGTEPKIKFYFMVRGEDEASCDRMLDGLVSDVKIKLQL